MVPGVLGLVGKYVDVIRVIVRLISVMVMDDFPGHQVTAQLQFSDDLVAIHVAAGVREVMPGHVNPGAAVIARCSTFPMRGLRSALLRPPNT